MGRVWGNCGMRTCYVFTAYNEVDTLVNETFAIVSPSLAKWLQHNSVWDE